MLCLLLTQRHRLFDFWLKQFCHRGKDRHDHRDLHSSLHDALPIYILRIILIIYNAPLWTFALLLSIDASLSALALRFAYKTFKTEMCIRDRHYSGAAIAVCGGAAALSGEPDWFAADGESAGRYQL